MLGLWAFYLRRMFLRTGPFDGLGTNVPPRQAVRVLDRPIDWFLPGLGDRELAFLGHALESLGRALDAILAIVTFGGKLPDHLIGAARGRARNVAGSKVNGRSNGEFVLQRPLHHTEKAGRAFSPDARLG